MALPAYPEFMVLKQPPPDGTTRVSSAPFLLVFAASLAMSAAIWHWLPGWAPTYRAAIVALAALAIVALWGGELRQWWKHRRSH